MAAPVNYRQHQKRNLVWGVGDQVFADGVESNGPRRELRTSVARQRKGYQGANRFLYFVQDAIGGGWAVNRDVSPDFREVRQSVRMEDKTAH